MRVQNIESSCTRQEWLHILEKTFEYPTIDYQGHSYIYINPKGQIDSFYTFPEAFEEQFFWKLTIDDIIFISKEVFEDYQQCPTDEIDILRHAFESMDKGGVEIPSSWTSRFVHWYSCFVHWFRGLGFKNTHEIIDEQLQLLIEQQIQSQYQQFRQKLGHLKGAVHYLTDERFSQAYLSLFQNAQTWVQSFEINLPLFYQQWKTQEEILTNFILEAQQLNMFSERTLYVTDQNNKLAKLLLLHPLDSDKTEKVREFELRLTQLIDQLFDKYIVHDNEAYLQRFDELDAEIEELQRITIEDYESQKDSKPQLIQNIFSPNENKLRASPLKGLPNFLKKITNQAEIPEIFDAASDVIESK